MAMHMNTTPRAALPARKRLHGTQEAAAAAGQRPRGDGRGQQAAEGSRRQQGAAGRGGCCQRAGCGSGPAHPPPPPPLPPPGQQPPHLKSKRRSGPRPQPPQPGWHPVSRLKPLILAGGIPVWLASQSRAPSISAGEGYPWCVMVWVAISWPPRYSACTASGTVSAGAGARGSGRRRRAGEGGGVRWRGGVSARRRRGAALCPPRCLPLPRMPAGRGARPRPAAAASAAGCWQSGPGWRPRAGRPTPSHAPCMAAWPQPAWPTPSRPPTHPPVVVTKKVEGTGQPLRCRRPPRMLCTAPYACGLTASSQVMSTNCGTRRGARPPGGAAHVPRRAGVHG